MVQGSNPCAGTTFLYSDSTTWRVNHGWFRIAIGIAKPRLLEEAQGGVRRCALGYPRTS